MSSFFKERSNLAFSKMSKTIGDYFTGKGQFSTGASYYRSSQELTKAVEESKKNNTYKAQTSKAIESAKKTKTTLIIVVVVSIIIGFILYKRK